MRQDVASPGCQQTGSRPPSKDEQGIRDDWYGEGWAGRARVYHQVGEERGSLRNNFFFLKNSPEPAGGLSRIGVLRVDFRELYLRVDFHELENSGYFRELYLRVDFNLKFSPIFTCFVGREKVGRSSHRFLETCP